MHVMTQGRYLTLSIGKNGCTIKLTPEGREYINDLDEKPRIDFAVFYDLFEDFRCNSEWETLSAEEIGAMTGCQLIISPDAQRDENGELTEIKTVFWHERYAIEDAIERLLENENGLFLLRAGPYPDPVS